MANAEKRGLVLAVKEHIASGTPITALEAICLYGVAHLYREITRLREQGWVIEKRKIPMIRAIRRMEDYIEYVPPNNLPVTKIELTEYWLVK
jgi:hypothetical protein